MKRSTWLATGFSLLAATTTANASTDIREALLVEDFISALTTYADGGRTDELSDVEKLWVAGFEKRGIARNSIDKRLRKGQVGPYKIAGDDTLSEFRQIRIDPLPTTESDFVTAPVALHAFRLDVVEDYDDTWNDDLYCYFITTTGDLVWGKVTSIYRGLDEGDSFFLSPADRGLFGPRGEKLPLSNHLILDVGIVESDGEDIKELQQLTDAILDLAVVALSLYDPGAGSAAAQAKAETENLIRLVLSLDDDDRLVTDTLHLRAEQVARDLGNGTFYEFTRFYERETFWTHYAYRLRFRFVY